MLSDTISLIKRYLMPVVSAGVLANCFLIALLRLGNRGELNGGAGDDGGAGVGGGAGGEGGAGAGTTTIGADTPLSMLAEDLRADQNVGKYKTIGDLVKGHVETVKLVGRKGVILPAENASDEERAKFYNAIGRPEKPEAYKITPLEGLHPSVKVTPESTAVFQQAAHKLGLSQAQFDGLNQWYLKTVSDAVGRQEQAQAVAMKEAATKLRNEWGGEFDQNLVLAKRVAEKFAGKEAVSELGDLGNSPTLLRLLASVGKKLSEDSIARGEVSSLTGTPQDAQAKINAILKDSKHPYFDAKHPDHDVWAGPNGEFFKLQKLANPERE